MQQVGIRELKMRLSHHLKRVRKGERLVVTERGQPVAVLAPVDTADNLDWLHRMIAEGRAEWSGGKPKGLSPGARLRPGSPTVSQTILEDRR